MSPKGYAAPKQSLALQLFEAVEERSLHEVLTLLDRDQADPNYIIPDKGISPFHLVIGCECSYFAEEATRAILQHNGNPNVRSEDGLTPVHVAAVWGRTGLLVLLLSCGGDPWLRDVDRGVTPLHLALKEKHWETALVLQRYQLIDRRHRRSDVQTAPRFNMNLESVVVSAGEMQAEYSASHQQNLYPILSPLQEPKKVNSKFAWNIEPLESHEYVRQWCHKEFTPLPITSTPTHHKTARQQNIQASCTERSPNITSSKEMTPKHVDYGRNIPIATTCSKNFEKPPVDVRKKLFLELKKRFNGLKQSFDLSKEDSSKGNLFERSTGYFGRKSFRKSQKIKTNCSEKSIEKASENDDSSSASGYLSVRTSRSVDSVDAGNCSDPIIESETPSSIENSPVDEVDAVPLSDSVNTSVEWIASQSCFLEERSPNSSNSQSFVTCDEGPTLDMNNAISLPHAHDVFLTREEEPKIDLPEEPPKRPPRRKQLRVLNNTVAPSSVPSNTPSSVSFGTIVSEEYRYTDDDAGIVLIESHLLTKPLEVPSPSDSESVVSVPQTVISDAPTASSDVSSVPASFCYDAATLRKELISFGEAVGPITFTTKKVYLRRLYRLKKKCQIPPTVSAAPVYSSELQRVLKGTNWEADILMYAKYDRVMCLPFENPDPNRRWREGVAKSSFNYLLLDPRVSNNLPASVTVFDLRTWHTFVSSVFYVGKGKRSRPYAHLYQAVHSWNKGEKLKNPNAKVQRILDIWRDGHGVVCLHVFQNIIPVEAFTREAAMIDAMGITNLVNVKGGEYYGPASTWRTRQKRQLGVYLLYRAMRIFLCEGERQLRPCDID